MSNIILMVGPSPSGKTTFASEWVAKSPQTRFKAGTIRDAIGFLVDNKDVVLDDELMRTEEQANDAKITVERALRGVHVEIKVFTHDPDFVDEPVVEDPDFWAFPTAAAKLAHYFAEAGAVSGCRKYIAVAPDLMQKIPKARISERKQMFALCSACFRASEKASA